MLLVELAHTNKCEVTIKNVEGSLMKYQPYKVDIRIKKFMKRKMSEFPDLNVANGPRIQVVQKSSLWDDLAGMFVRHQRAR